MGKLWATLKLGTKLGVAGGVLYVSDQYRLWGSHEDATKGLKQLRKDVTDNKYVSEIPNFEIPKEITDLVPKDMAFPETQNLYIDVRKHWNSGVMWVFSGLADLPNTLKSQTGVLTDLISKQLEMVSQPESKDAPIKQPDPKGSP